MKSDIKIELQVKNLLWPENFMELSIKKINQKELNISTIHFPERQQEETGEGPLRAGPMAEAYWVGH